MKKTYDKISKEFIEDVVERLKSNKRIKRLLPGGGRLHIDRKLPFLCVYRKPAYDDGGTDKFVTTGASYAIVSDENIHNKKFYKLLNKIVETLTEEFHSFLILEIWVPESNGSVKSEVKSLKPCFRILTNETKKSEISSTLKTLKERLSSITVLKQEAGVDLVYSKTNSPPGLPPLLEAKEAHSHNCHIVGLEITPIYINPLTHHIYPVIRRLLREQLNYILQYAFFEFSRSMTTHEPAHYQSMGKTFLSPAVWDVDKKFGELCHMFDFLRQASPINEAEARRDFQRHRYERSPIFFYRPLAFDPAEFKRKLWNIPIENIEDAVISQLFYEKRDELDTQVSMLTNLDSPGFLYGSLNLFGGVGYKFGLFAERLLGILGPANNGKDDKIVRSEKFYEFAKNEVEFYKHSYPEFTAEVEVSEDMYSGIMVSKNKLLIGTEFKAPYSRVNPLIQHEIGTHLITYFNGMAQPLQQLHIGFAGYDELQEGLAVLSEYLVGGLSAARLRLLAGRVIAAVYMLDGASFVDTFRNLTEKYGFNKFNAFTIVMRIYRGGGLTKDIIYLRGFLEILKYVRDGGELEPLFVGKISSSHIPLVKDLQIRNILKPAPLRPRYLSSPEAAKRLNRLHKGFSLLEFAKKLATN